MYTSLVGQLAQGHSQPPSSHCKLQHLNKGIHIIPFLSFRLPQSERLFNNCLVQNQVASICLKRPVRVLIKTTLPQRSHTRVKERSLLLQILTVRAYMQFPVQQQVSYFNTPDPTNQLINKPFFRCTEYVRAEKHVGKSCCKTRSAAQYENN